jgi:UDP-3-O-[3-hydroxymyristoyl] glucosamine N-acyltransferase
MMKGAVFYGWLLRSALRRVLFVPGLKWFLFASNVLRYLALRGLGARIAFTTSMSADVDLLDPSLLVTGPGTTFGARCFVSGHFVEGGKLVLGTVSVGQNSLLSADVMCAPSVEIGERVTVKARANVSVGTRIGDRAQIGAAAFLDSNVTVAPGAVVANNAYVAPRTEVAAARPAEAE